MLRNDLILIAALVLISVSPIFFTRGENNFAVIKINGVEKFRADLTHDEIFTIETDGGKNVVEVSGGEISVTDADCPDKICVKSGAIKNAGEVIACVPHKLLIEIVNS